MLLVLTVRSLSTLLVFPSTVFANQALKPASLSDIRKAWIAQAAAVTSCEAKFSETVNVSKAYAEEFQDAMRSLGQEVPDVPLRRENKLKVILDGPRLLFFQPFDNENTITHFYDGNEFRTLVKPTTGRPSGTILNSNPIAAASSVVALFLCFRGLEATFPGTRLEDCAISDGHGAAMTLMGTKNKMTFDLELDPAKGFMPIRYSTMDPQTKQKRFEAKITYREGDSVPFVPNTWSIVEFHRSGPITTVSQLDEFSTSPSINLKEYKLEFPEGTVIAGTTRRTIAIGSPLRPRLAATIISAIIVLALLYLVMRKHNRAASGTC